MAHSGKKLVEENHELGLIERYKLALEVAKAELKPLSTKWLELSTKNKPTDQEKKDKETLSIIIRGYEVFLAHLSQRLNVLEGDELIEGKKEKKEIKQEIAEGVAEAGEDATRLSEFAEWHEKYEKLKELSEVTEKGGTEFHHPKIEAPSFNIFSGIPIASDLVQGVLSIKSAIQAFRDKHLGQRKTRIAAGLTIGLLFVGAAIVASLFVAGAGAMATAAAIVAMPLVLTSVPLVSYVISFYKHMYIQHQLKKTIEAEEFELGKAFAALHAQQNTVNGLIAFWGSSPVSFEQKQELIKEKNKLAELKLNIAERQAKIEGLKEAHKAARINAAFAFVSIIAAGLAVAAAVALVFSNPVTGALAIAAVAVAGVSLAVSLGRKLLSWIKGKPTSKPHLTKNLLDEPKHELKDEFKPEPRLNLDKKHNLVKGSEARIASSAHIDPKNLSPDAKAESPASPRQSPEKNGTHFSFQNTLLYRRPSIPPMQKNKRNDGDEEGERKHPENKSGKH